MTDQEKPKLQLSGNDGNAFMILGNARKAAYSFGWDANKIKAFMDGAQSGDYNHLLQTCMKHFDVK